MDPLFEVLSKHLPQEYRGIDQEEWSGYMNHLRTLNATARDSERSYLDSSDQSISQTLLSLSLSSKPQFISGASNLNKSIQQFEALEELSSTLVDMPALDTLNKQETDSTSDSGEGAIVLLKNIDMIQDILELPSLALACVRNGYYSEAQDLAEHARLLETRFSNIRIISSIRQEVDKVLEVMSRQLLVLLRETTKLPVLIKVVSYYKRLDQHTENELHVLFLLSRMYFIRTQFKAIEPLKTQSPDKYIKRYIEIFREHGFATVANYHQVFDKTLFGEQMLADMIRTLVSDLHDMLAELAPLVTDQSTRDSIWLQLAYCSQSLGRIGAEFWPLLQEKSPKPISDIEWTNTLIKQRDISARLS